MKFFDLTFFFSTVVAAACANPIPEQSPQTVCGLTGTMGDVPANIRSSAFVALPGSSTPEACRAKCFSAECAQCKSFGIRQSGGGSCLLFDYNITPHIIPRQSVYTYFPLPEGIRGDVPENVAKHYYADISKTKGTYAGCHGVCLSDTRCKGFGHKDGRNYQLYDVSLEGKVKAKPAGLYIQYGIDCPAA